MACLRLSNRAQNLADQLRLNQIVTKVELQYASINDEEMKAPAEEMTALGVRSHCE